MSELVHRRGNLIVCVACGSTAHHTSDCPENNAAMAGHTCEKAVRAERERCAGIILSAVTSSAAMTYSNRDWYHALLRTAAERVQGGETHYLTSLQALEAAVMNERERCLLIAESNPHESIPAKIRSGEPAGETDV